MLSSIFLTLHHEVLRKPVKLKGYISFFINAFNLCWWTLDRFVINPFLVVPTSFVMNLCEKAYKAILPKALKFPILILSIALIFASSMSVLLVGATIPVPEQLAKVTGTNKIAIKPIGNELVPGVKRRHPVGREPLECAAHAHLDVRRRRDRAHGDERGADRVRASGRIPAGLRLHGVDLHLPQRRDPPSLIS